MLSRSRIAVASFLFSFPALTSAWTSSAAIPASHTHAMTKVNTSSGLALIPASAAKLSLMTGLTASSMTGTPLVIVGLGSNCTTSGEIVSALGMSESALSMENGQMSRSAVTPHSSGMIHFGAFLRTNRSASTARMSQPALMLRFTAFRNTSVMLSPPSGSARSSAAPRPAPARSCGGTWQRRRRTQAASRRSACRAVRRSRRSAPRPAKRAR